MKHNRFAPWALSSTAILLMFSPFAEAQKPTKTPKIEGRKAKAIRAVRMTGTGGPRKPPTQAELKQRLAKKLKGEWIANAPWGMDYDTARQQAKTSGKQIFAYFTRSYAP